MRACRILLVLCVSTTLVHGAELLVITSTSPAYVRGLVLEGGDNVTIREDESLTLIASNGKGKP